jgi:hypothetical protein
MSKTTFMGYVPSLKEKHESKIVGSKAIESKGGSIRYTLQGEYEGRNTLPKTVSKADFEGIYGFDAKAAESAIIIGKNKKGDVDVIAYTNGFKDKTGFTPEKIYFSNVNHAVTGLPYLQNYSNHAETYEDAKDADTVGSPSPATINQPAPSEDPFPQEPSNASFSAECGDGGQNPCKECGGHPCPRCNAPHPSSEDSIETKDGDVCLPCATDAETREAYFWNDLLGGYMTREDMLEEYPERKDDIDNSRNPEMRKPSLRYDNPYQESYQPKEIDIEEIERLGMEKDEREIKKLMDEKGLTYEEARQMKMDKAIDQIPHWESNEVKEAFGFGKKAINGAENFSAEYNPSEILRDEEEEWVKRYDEYMEDPQPDIEASDAMDDLVLWTPTLEEFKKERLIEMYGYRAYNEVYLKYVQDLKDGEINPTDAPKFFNAFGFGKKDEEAEPKTQEFTVVMQEGDKLELTDIEDDEPKEEDNDSNEEKEAEYYKEFQDIKWGDVKEMDNSKCPFCFRSAFRLIDEEGEEFSVYEEDIAGDNWLLECSRCKAEWNQDGENTLDGGYTGNAEYEAVSAKVTRPVKEEEEETEEGLSTLAKVGIGLGALAVGALVLGAEDEGESDYWTGDSALWRAEYVSGAETFGAFSIDEDDEGKIHIENKCDGCGKEFFFAQNTHMVGGGRAGAIVYEKLGSSADGHLNIYEPTYSPYGDLLCKSCYKEDAEEDDFQRYNRGQGQYDAEIFEARLKNQKVFCKEHGMWYKLNHQTGLNQLTRGTGCEGCINKHKGKKAETFEPSKFGYPLGVEPSRWDFGDETSATRWRKSQGKTKTHKIVRIPLTGMDIPAFFRVQKKAENFSAEGDGLKAFAKNIETEKKKLIKKAKRSGFYENFGNKETRKLADSIPRTLSYSEQDQYFNLVDNFSMWAMNLDLRELEYQSETVGTPSPSGPSSTPEPAEATGSEPSNETFEAESGSKNLKMALGITAVGIGLAAVLGKDKITKLFDKLGL